MGFKERLTVGSIAPSGTLEANVVKGHLNKILVIVPNAQVDDIKNLEVSCKRTTKERTFYHVPNINAAYFLDKTNATKGSIGGVNRSLERWVEVMADYLEGGADDAVYQAMSNSVVDIANYGAVAFYVDLGSIMLDNGDEVQFSLTNKSGSKTFSQVSILKISDEDEGYHYFTYDSSVQMNDSHQNVVELDILDSTKLYAGDEMPDYEVYVDGVVDTFMLSGNELRLANALESRTEGEIIKTLQLWSGYIPEDVKVKITGDTSTLTIYAKRFHGDGQTFLRQKNDMLEAKAKIMSRFERNHPESAQVFALEGADSSAKMRSIIK